jgi:Transposase zinc-binding domain/Putative transposase
MLNSPVPYIPRNPQLSDHYRCVEDYFEELERVHEERYQAQLGYLRPDIRVTIFRYLDCGCLQNGFARVVCEDCGYECLVAFSCKRRHFCPSCHQKRVLEFGDWFLDELAVAVPHRHLIFSIPKLLRSRFLFQRALLADLSRVAWETLKEYLSGMSTLVCACEAIPGAACSIQTFGDFLNFNPHCHLIISDGAFDAPGNFHVTPYYDTFALAQLFRHKLLKMLLEKGVITQWHIDLLRSWRHSGFNVHVGEPVAEEDHKALENLAHYIIRCQFSQERMTYHEANGTVD